MKHNGTSLRQRLFFLLLALRQQMSALQFFLDAWQTLPSLTRKQRIAAHLGFWSFAAASACCVFCWTPRLINVHGRRSGRNGPPRWFEHFAQLGQGSRAIVDLDAFDRNVDRALRGIGNEKMIRIATKSIRSIDLIIRFMDRVRMFGHKSKNNGGPQLAGLMCFTAAEVLALSRSRKLVEAASPSSSLHLLLAYPILDRQSAMQLVEATRSSPSVTIAAMVDCREHIEILAATDPERRLQIWIDVDMAWQPLGGLIYVGVRRSPLDNIDKINAVVEHVYKYGYRLSGLMGYEAQIAGMPDWVEGSASLPFIVRKALKALAARAIANRRRGVLDVVMKTVRRIAAGASGAKIATPLQMNGGGSGCIDYTARDDAVTEITVGSAALCGTQFDGYSPDSMWSNEHDDRAFEPSLYFALRATRHPSPASNIVTCHGGGWIASGDYGVHRRPRIVWPFGATFLSMEGAGEVQTPIQLPSGESHFGGLVLMRPCKSGEIAEHFETYATVACADNQDGAFSCGEVKTYRGDGIHAW